MVAFVPMNINREESIETVLMHVDHAINYGDDLEPQVNVRSVIVIPVIDSHDTVCNIYIFAGTERPGYRRIDAINTSSLRFQTSSCACRASIVVEVKFATNACKGITMQKLSQNAFT